MLQDDQMLLLPGGDINAGLKRCRITHQLQSSPGVYLASRTWGKNRKSVLWNPSVCTQQPCTSVRMTLLTRTRFTDLDGDMNKRQYNSKRSGITNRKETNQRSRIRILGLLNVDNCYFFFYIYKLCLTDCATAGGPCHTSTCAQTGCPSPEDCCSLLHRQHSCGNSAGPPSRASAARCTSAEAHLHPESRCFHGQPGVVCTNEAFPAHMLFL